MTKKTRKPASGKKSFSRPSRASVVTLAVMFVATAAVAGTSLVVKSQPATFEEVAGVSSIDAGLASSGGEGNLVRITNGDGKIDLLYIGAPECGHCQNFMKNGFDDMVAQAEDRGLDFAYFPAAMTPVGVTIATLEACVVGDTSGAAKVKAAYGLNESVTAGAIAAQDLQKSGTPSAEISAYFTNLLETSQRAFGEEEVFDAQCYEREAAGMISRLNEVHRTFGLTGTPSFYFMDADGIMREQVGDYANAQMMSQVAPAK